MYHAILYTPGGAAATAQGVGTIRDGHLEDRQGQVGRFGGSAPSFLLAMHLVGRVKTSALLTGDI